MQDRMGPNPSFATSRTTFVSGSLWQTWDDVVRRCRETMSWDEQREGKLFPLPTPPPHKHKPPSPPKKQQKQQTKKNKTKQKTTTKRNRNYLEGVGIQLGTRSSHVIWDSLIYQTFYKGAFTRCERLHDATKTCDKIALCKRAYLCDMRLLHAVAGKLKSSNFLATIACRNKPVSIVRFWRMSHVFVASCNRAFTRCDFSCNLQQIYTLKIISQVAKGVLHVQQLANFVESCSEK